MELVNVLLPARKDSVIEAAIASQNNGMRARSSRNFGWPPTYGIECMQTITTEMSSQLYPGIQSDLHTQFV